MLLRQRIHCILKELNYRKQSFFAFFLGIYCATICGILKEKNLQHLPKVLLNEKICYSLKVFTSSIVHCKAFATPSPYTGSAL
jgi:hypothetical protein